MAISDFLLAIASTNATLLGLGATVSIALFVFHAEKIRALLSKVSDICGRLDYWWAYEFDEARLQRHVTVFHKWTLQQLNAGGVLARRGPAEEKLGVFERAWKSAFEDYATFQNEVDNADLVRDHGIGPRQQRALRKSELRHRRAFGRVRALLTALDLAWSDLSDRLRKRTVLVLLLGINLVFMVILVFVPTLHASINEGSVYPLHLFRVPLDVRYVDLGCLTVYVALLVVLLRSVVGQTRDWRVADRRRRHLSDRIRGSTFWKNYYRNR